MNQISVIGATSSLGIRLISDFAAQGFRVHASYRDRGRVPEEWSSDANIELVRLDLTDPNADFRPLARGIVIWLAHLGQGRFNDRETETNLAPFSTFLETAERNGLERFVFVSSGGSVYGTPHMLPITEEHPRAPLSSYGRAKAAMEDRLGLYSDKFRTAVIRPGNIYGFESPNRRCHGIIAAYLNAIRTNSPFTLIHEGRTVRDFVHIDDVATAINAAVTSNLRNIVWNVATGQGHSAADVLNRVLDASGFAPPVIHQIENPISDVDQNILSIERICRESGWKPRISLDRGIEMLIGKWRDQERSMFS